MTQVEIDRLSDALAEEFVSSQMVKTASAGGTAIGAGLGGLAGLTRAYLTESDDDIAAGLGGRVRRYLVNAIGGAAAGAGVGHVLSSGSGKKPAPAGTPPPRSASAVGAIVSSPREVSAPDPVVAEVVSARRSAPVAPPVAGIPQSLLRDMSFNLKMPGASLPAGVSLPANLPVPSPRAEESFPLAAPNVPIAPVGSGGLPEIPVKNSFESPVDMSSLESYVRGLEPGLLQSFLATGAGRPEWVGPVGPATLRSSVGHAPAMAMIGASVGAGAPEIVAGARLLGRAAGRVYMGTVDPVLNKLSRGLLGIGGGRFENAARSALRPMVAGKDDKSGSVPADVMEDIARRAGRSAGGLLRLFPRGMQSSAQKVMRNAVRGALRSEVARTDSRISGMIRAAQRNAGKQTSDVGGRVLLDSNARMGNDALLPISDVTRHMSKEKRREAMKIEAGHPVVIGVDAQGNDVFLPAPSRVAAAVGADPPKIPAMSELFKDLSVVDPRQPVSQWSTHAGGAEGLDLRGLGAAYVDAAKLPKETLELISGTGATGAKYADDIGRIRDEIRADVVRKFTEDRGVVGMPSPQHVELETVKRLIAGATDGSLQKRIRVERIAKAGGEAWKAGRGAIKPASPDEVQRLAKMLGEGGRMSLRAKVRGMLGGIPLTVENLSKLDGNLVREMLTAPDRMRAAYADAGKVSEADASAKRSASAVAEPGRRRAGALIGGVAGGLFGSTMPYVTPDDRAMTENLDAENAVLKALNLPTE